MKHVPSARSPGVGGQRQLSRGHLRLRNGDLRWFATRVFLRGISKWPCQTAHATCCCVLTAKCHRRAAARVCNIWMLRLPYLCVLIVPLFCLWCSISQVALMSKGVFPAALSISHPRHYLAERAGARAAGRYFCVLALGCFAH